MYYYDIVRESNTMVLENKFLKKCIHLFLSYEYLMLNRDIFLGCSNVVWILSTECPFVLHQIPSINLYQGFI